MSSPNGATSLADRSIDVPFNIVNGNHSEMVAYLVLNIWPSHFGLPLLLLVIMLSKKIQRSTAFLNMLVVWIIVGISSTLLLYAGKQTGEEPPKMLCLFQAALIYGMPPMTSTATLALVLQMFLSVRKAYLGEKSKPGDGIMRTWLLLIAPYVALLLTVIATAVLLVQVGASNPSKISRNRRFFYCSVEADPLTNTMTVAAALILLATVILETWTVVYLYWLSRTIKRTGGKISSIIDLSFPIRIIAFGFYVMIALSYLRNTEGACGNYLRNATALGALVWGVVCEASKYYLYLYILGTLLAMAARKLQSEIDRTLKKVSEGVELFESIYDKMQSSTNQTQKEKLENDLKTQIKKLQRLRDQIKTWVASNDIKDKSVLLENRRLIETQMEKFKACEKEMKTKAFSKEGLIQAAKLDPKEQEKEEATIWLQSQVEELQMQVEATEAEVEALQGTGKKRKGTSNAAGRLEELERLNERRKWHISRLEIVLRLLNNGSLPAEKVMGLKDDVQYFVESNTDEDFDEYEGVYDELNLDEEEEKFGLVQDEDGSEDSDEASEEDLPPRTPSSKKHDEESITSSKRDESPILRKATATLQLRSKPPPTPTFSQQPVKAVPPTTPARSNMTPIRYAAAAAAAVATPATTQTTAPSQAPVPSSSHLPASSSGQPPISSSLTQDSLSGISSSPSLTHPSVTSPMLSSSASVSQQPDGSFYSGQESPALSDAVVSSIGAPAAASSPQRRKASISSPLVPSQLPNKPAVSSPLLTSATLSQLNGTSQQSTQAVPSSTAPPPPEQAQYTQTLAAPPNLSDVPSPSPSAAQAMQFPPGVKIPQGPEQASTSQMPAQQQPPVASARPPSTSQSQPPPRSSTASAFPGSLSDLVTSFEGVKQKAAMRMSNLDQVHKMLEGGYPNMPQPQDTAKPKYYVPRTPFQTPPYYPQSPHPLLNTAGIFSQLDVETLFYVFYFLPGTYQQYLAAKELKRQSWRFHVKYLTWFQRHSEPQAITEEYEQGVYVYFDWEGSWCQRKKADFRFEYRYLSED
ncbi:protein ral negative regulator of transcription subunit 5 [Pleurotus pulmonarius]|nr:protein ral negative regulator of transcription subunit 5 [Pleurotus pulmonarius]